jgi:DNA-binding SARP family transcriptional activator
MLKALIALGGRDVSEGQLTDELWPEADGDAAHKAFSVTLTRLRQLLGTDGVVQLSEGRVTLDQRLCWVDVWAFERMLGRSKKESGKKEGKAILIEKGLSLYQGPFLSGEGEGPWLIAYRERLRNKFLSYTGELGRLYEEAGEYKRAVERFKKCLEVDEMSEESCQRLMLCYERLGRRAEAASVYRRFKEVLSKTLGVEPSPQTEKIYKSILSR